MSTKTTNFEFIKPEKTDTADITAINENWDKLDTALGEVKVYEATDEYLPFRDILPLMDIGESKFIVCNVTRNSYLSDGCWLFQLTRNKNTSYGAFEGSCVGASINGESIKGLITNLTLMWYDKWNSRSQIRYNTIAPEDLDDPEGSDADVFNAPDGTLYLVYEV